MGRRSGFPGSAHLEENFWSVCSSNQVAQNQSCLRDESLDTFESTVCIASYLHSPNARH